MSNEKSFLEESKQQQQSINERDLKELKQYYGSWDELRKLIDQLEQSEDEDAAERHYSGGSDAWGGGFADNH